MTSNTENKTDRRQLVGVFLVADGRQKYFQFHCVYCGTQVASMQGAEVYQLRDVDDLSREVDKPRLNVRCYGKFCRTVYLFTLN